jgi:predicted phage-related endonuclease
MKETRSAITQTMEERQTEEILVDVFKVRYITVISNRFDTTTFKATHKDLYSEYLKPSECKRFTVA